jgi:hypothetical protein
VHGSHGTGLTSNAQRSPFWRDAALCCSTSGQCVLAGKSANKRVDLDPAVTESQQIHHSGSGGVVARVRPHAFAASHPTADRSCRFTGFRACRIPLQVSSQGLFEPWHRAYN